MKILIIAVIRVGGSYLFQSLANTYNIKTRISEPRELIKPIDSTIVKVNIGMVSDLEIIDYSKYFDYVVILDRKNKKEQAESAYISKKIGKPHSKYTIKELDDKLINEWETTLTTASTKIQYISKVLNNEIYYYEDLYFGNKKIKNLIFEPDISKKLRQSTIII